MSEAIKAVESCATVAIKTPEELIRLVMFPNTTVTVSGDMLESAGCILDGLMDRAETLPSVDLVREFSRLRNIFKRLLDVTTDGSSKAVEELNLLPSRAMLSANADRAALIVARRLMNPVQNDELNRILDEAEESQ